ncbi:phospholipase D-like domain-containing protein [Leptospira adleri]|uniref:phospholipase D n=1 Tax=Leptospira adleri TaxID=2023186 RepID=A0A2M9YU14_9LEPT|nr:phospholipase D-like domain-containing protein [Leptospira adleri]PJZ55028.1 PLD-like domain protein [Leptospira adleri]PJZ63730.1 PLD-like domain protein [Leptospira adleri]
MKINFNVLLILIFLHSCSHPSDQDLFWLDWTRPRNMEAYFSFPGRYTPDSKKRNVRDRILSLLEEAQHSLDLWIYSFDDSEILEALQRARKRGVKIQIVADPEKEYPADLIRLGLFRRWERSGLQHSKILIVDRRKVFLGSGNFTWYGLENDLNGYVRFGLNEDESSDFYSFLEEDPGIAALDIPPFLFYIAPEKGRLIQNLLLREVDQAKSSIRYLIFDHFDSVLSSRLALADRKGVVVQGVYDSPVDEEGKFLANLWTSSRSQILGDGNEETISTDSFGKGGLLHHKTMILDGNTLLTGSFNFSVSARDDNREILFRTNDSYLLQEYKKEWDRVFESAIPYQTFIPKKEEIRSVDFGFAEDSLPNGSEQTLCRERFENEESFYLESGSAFLKFILEYTFDSGERCKTVGDFSSASSGFSGRKTNHPVRTRNFRQGSKLFNKNGILLLDRSTVETDPTNFDVKPAFLFLPDFFSLSSGNILLPSSVSEIGNPLRVRLYQKGSGPNLVFWNRIGSFLNIPSLPNEGIIFLEYESEILTFCFHDRTKKGTEYTELLNEVISFRISGLTIQKRSEEKGAIDQRRRFDSYCYRY